jgi:ankyrin repeat protein
VSVAPVAEKPAPPITSQAFRQAALEGQISTIREALDQGADVDATDTDGRSALQLAAFDGHTDVVKLLLDHGARVDHRDALGRTALIYAATGPNQATVKVLLAAGADPDVVDRGERFSALMFAAAEGQHEVVKTLLQHNANAGLHDVDGDTARDFAAQNQHREIVRMLDETKNKKNEAKK